MPKILDRIKELNTLSKGGEKKALEEACKKLVWEVDADILMLLIITYDQLGQLDDEVFGPLMDHQVRRLMKESTPSPPDDFLDFMGTL